MSFLQPSQAESRRFGLSIARGRGDLPDASALVEEIVRLGIDIAIVRVPSTDSEAASRLAACGMTVIHADTLVYYQCRLDTTDPRPARNADLEIAPASAADHAELATLARECFAGYASHYSANPLLDRARVADGYTEWAVSHLQSHGNVWVARRGGTMIGFICCDDRADQDECEIVLNGVHPSHAGGGVYGDLVRHVQRHFKGIGRRVLLVSTQVINIAVQKAWVREGLALASSMQTFHVNALLGGGELALDRLIPPDPADATIAQIMESAVRETLPGARLLRTNLIYRAPLEMAVDYRLQLRLPAGPAAAGPIQVVATIGNGAGERCVVGYHDLLMGE